LGRNQNGLLKGGNDEAGREESQNEKCKMQNAKSGNGEL
jgi:hypothetical protein